MAPVALVETQTPPIPVEMVETPRNIRVIGCYCVNRVGILVIGYSRANRVIILVIGCFRAILVPDSSESISQFRDIHSYSNFALISIP